MEKIPMYLNDKEIARKITEYVSSATGNDIQEHNRKFGRIMVLLRLYGILLIQLCARLSIKMNARHTLFHAGHGRWLLYTVRRTAVFTLLCEKNAFQNCRERK